MTPDSNLDAQGKLPFFSGRYFPLFLGALIILLAGIAILSMMIGRYTLDPGTILAVLTSQLGWGEKVWTSAIESVVLEVRLPRVIGALLAGGGLAISGAALQGLFRNPLVSSDILGVSSGAGFGAAIAILITDSILVVELSSFLFGLIAVALTFWISRVNRQTPLLMLILSGIVVGSFFMALTSICKYVADPMNKMPTIVFWLLGSLNHVSRSDLIILGPVILGSAILLVLLRWRINLISMGDEEARALGVNTEQMKILLIITTTLITAATVSMCGMIGWVGLVIPHIGRILVGPDNRRLIPVTFLIGGIFLILVDTLARTLTPAEIPIGLLTAGIGAPLFAILIRFNRVGW
jgi:iron complex transport system permease protein